METNKDSKAYTPAGQSAAVFGMARVIEGITIHWWGDPNQNPQFDSIVNYLCRDGGNTSAHYIATGTGRRVACIVAPTDVAWHSGSAWGNARRLHRNLDPRARDEDYDVAAELIADIRSAFGDVPIYWHSYFVSTSCPGVWNPERLDALSYTKFSAPINWGEGGDINPKTPPPVVVPPVVTPPTTDPKPSLYRLLVDGKQVAAYSTDVNAFRGYVQRGKTGVIKLDGKDVTAELLAKFTTASPTTQDPTGNPLPDTGAPITDKHDYSEENNSLLKQILTLLQGLIAKITGIFK